jgi:tetratricopeptide (TPR) repeat protein
MAIKKKSRKQLLNEPDEFITFSSKLLRFVMEHKIQISSAIGVVLVLTALLSGYFYSLNKAENKASALLEACMTQYETILKDKGPDKACRDMEKDFQIIFEKYSKTAAGKLARVNYANICYNAGDYEKAITLYENAVAGFDDKPLFKNLILSGLGYAYEGIKDFKTAAACFEKIAQGQDAVMKDEALFNLGRLYASTGDKGRSMDAFKKIVAEYTDSLYFELAKEKVKVDRL